MLNKKTSNAKVETQKRASANPTEGRAFLWL